MKTNNPPYALIAGSTLLLMAVAAGFSYGYVHNSLVVENDPKATYENIRLSGRLFQAGIGGWGLIFLCDLTVSWALYHYFKRLGQKMSLLSSGLRLVYTIFLLVGIVHLILALLPMDSGVHKSPELQLAAHLQAFEQSWSAGLIVFGLHMLALAYLVFHSLSIPRLFAYLLLLADISYFVIHAGRFFMLLDGSLLDQAEKIFSLPMAVGELGFALWLLIGGRRAEAIPVRKKQSLKQV